MNRAVFLDRDGVINKWNPGGVEDKTWYCLSWGEFEFIPGVFEAFRIFRRADYIPIVVSNQSCVGRGLVTDSAVRSIFIKMQFELEVAMRMSLMYWYFCPHAPDAGCACRKPKPGMIYKAAVEHEIDLGRSWMAGDSRSDMDAGWNAGMDRSQCILITEKPQPIWGAEQMLPNLLEAAKFIAGREQ